MDVARARSDSLRHITDLEGTMIASATAGDTPVLTHNVRYAGTGSGLFLIFFKNLLLTIVTFGIYLPWARTERRKYLWQNLEFGGQRFRWHGTGRELFFGYLKVLGGYLV